MKKYKLTEYITFQPSKIKMTTTTINNTFAMPSIYIPRAHISCNTPDLIEQTINDILGYDCVSKVTIIPKTDQKTGFQFVSVFVNFKVWPRGGYADLIYNDLMTGTPVILRYTDEQTNGYWKCFLARPREKKVILKKNTAVSNREDEILDRV